MATNRKRYIISVNDRMYEEISKFKDEHFFVTYSSAIQELIRMGLVALREDEERRKNGK